MRNLNIDWRRWFPGLACFFLLSFGMARAVEPTAFELIKEGNRYLGEQSKDKVMQSVPRNPSAASSRAFGKSCISTPTRSPNG